MLGALAANALHSQCMSWTVVSADPVKLAIRACIPGYPHRTEMPEAHALLGRATLHAAYTVHLSFLPPRLFNSLVYDGWLGELSIPCWYPSSSSKRFVWFKIHTDAERHSITRETKIDLPCRADDIQECKLPGIELVSGIKTLESSCRKGTHYHSNKQVTDNILDDKIQPSHKSITSLCLSNGFPRI